MSNLSDSLRQQVRQRAGNRCEYCLSHQDYVMGILQVDHVYPVSKGGQDTADNLCLACELCNLYKWAKIEAIDPQTQALIELFNPRQQKWSEHFAWSNDGTEIVGSTACGRATVVALRLNNSLSVTVRRNWVRAGWHPPTSLD
jgi:HNH endonuclease